MTCMCLGLITSDVNVKAELSSLLWTIRYQLYALPVLLVTQWCMEYTKYIPDYLTVLLTQGQLLQAHLSPPSVWLMRIITFASSPFGKTALETALQNNDSLSASACVIFLRKYSI